MATGIFALLGIIIGGCIAWGGQYYFRREERKWEEKNEKKKVCIECMDILRKILDFYDNLPQSSEDNDYFKRINEDVRKSKVKLKVLFGNENKEIIECFEDADRALKSFLTIEKGEKSEISKKARLKIEKFENLLIDYFQ